jgi:hypothetical protein
VAPPLYLGALFAPLFVILVMLLAQVRPLRALSVEPRLLDLTDIDGADGVLVTALDAALRTLVYLAQINALVQIPKEVWYKP